MYRVHLYCKTVLVIPGMLQWNAPIRSSTNPDYVPVSVALRHSSMLHSKYSTACETSLTEPYAPLAELSL